MKHFRLFSLFFLLFLSSSLFAQVSYNTFVASIMNQVNQDTVFKYERQLCGDTSCLIGGSSYTILSRNYNSTHNPKAAQYIYEKFQSFGLTTWYQNITSTNINVLARKTGTKYPNQYVIICGHYDDMPLGTTAPGADDNASGTVCVMEAARLLRNINLPYTIIFAAWDEEEKGLYGSKAYADTAFAHGDSIIAVLNFDMIAYDGNNDGQLDVNTNAASTPLANNYAQIVSLYQPTLIPQVTTSLNGGSDHQSFQQRGYQAILAIEDNSDFTPYYHTTNDLYSTLNKPYFIKMVKAGIAALVTIAGDFQITMQHTPIETGPSTSSRIATAIIKSSYKIATGTNQPRLYYSVNNGAFNYLTPSYSNLDTVKFTIPGQSTGTTIKYYIAAQDSAGTLISTLPSGGTGVNPPGTTPPATQFIYQVANITIVTIGNGTSTESYPIDRYYNYMRWQAIYTRSEIGTTGNISKIKFYQANAMSGVTNGPISIYMKMVSDETLATGNWDVVGHTTVFTGTINNLDSPGWLEITLSNPFSFNMSLNQNLLISIDRGYQAFLTSYPLYNYTTLTTYKSRRNRNDTEIPTSLTQSYYRANLQLEISASTGLINPVSGIPSEYNLKQNYPNPFNPVTKLQYEVPKTSYVTIKVYDILGREVATLVNANMEAGYYMYDFDASALSSGVYIYKMTAGTFEKTMRMMVVK
ncbi:MAG: M20/M25/M40 family metallo-hydrolase [Ignavibacteria bacterium]